MKWGQQEKWSTTSKTYNMVLIDFELRCIVCKFTNSEFTNCEFVKWGQREKWRTMSITEMDPIDFELQSLDA